MKNIIIKSSTIGIGAFTGTILIQPFDSIQPVDFNRAIYIGLAFFAVVSIASLLGKLRTR